MSDIIIYCVPLLLGLAVGSYLNSWVWRVHERQWRFGGRSKCVHCSRELTASENIPLVSYLMLRGKCKTCGGAIPMDYFLVELITPLLLILVTYIHLNFFFWNPWHYFRDIFFTIVLISIFVYDYKYMEIRSGVVWGGTLVALIINYSQLHLTLYSLLLGMVVGGIFFLIQYLVSRGTWVGGGDVRLGVMIGALVGWPNIILAYFLSYILGTCAAVPMLMGKKKDVNSEVPFGTFLAVGTFVAMMWGVPIVNWYMRLVRW